MAIHAVFTLGLRDVRYNVGTDTEPRFLSCDFKGNEDAELAAYLHCDNGARFITLKLHERVKANPHDESGRFRLPIITPCLEYLVKEAETERLETILFVVTDQPEAEPKRITDTVNMASLCEELLQTTCLANSSVEFGTLVVGADPDQYVSAYRQIGRQLPSLLPLRAGDRCYMFLSAGIQAVAQALRQHGLRLYEEAWIPCQVKEPRDPTVLHKGECSSAGSVKALDRENPFLEDALIRTVRTLVERYDYTAAWQVWRSSLLRTSPMTDMVKPVLLHAIARLNNDLDEAYSLAPKLASDLAPASRTIPIELREVRDGADVALKHGQLLQFIIRIATFYENGLRYLAAELTEDNTWLRAKEMSPETLLRVLGRPVGWAVSQTSRGVYLIDRQILKTVTGTKRLYVGKRKSELENICTKLNQLDRVYDLRNDLLHRAGSVTENSIKDQTGLSCKDIMKRCDEVLKKILANPGANAYLGVNAELLRHLTYTFER